ncbi:putative ATP-dependent peptidase [Diaporthe sp. PMI_573]|nr:putative ATP-dependent peptidase [Diaporthaceae sp. PMI_573]
MGVMAFQSALLPNMAAATAEIWPSVAYALAMPRTATSVTTRTTPSTSAHQHGRQPTSYDIRSIFSDMSPFTLAAAVNPLLQPTALRTGTRISTSPMTRLFSTSTARGALRCAPLLQTRSPLRDVITRLSASSRPNPSVAVNRFTSLSPYVGLLQRRGFSNGGISRNMLANLEAAANRNPASPTAQNAFYQVLLKANMPGIIVERYQSGRYARNQAVEDVYAKALSMINGNKVAEVGAVDGQASALNQSQLQAIGQAVAASAKGGNIAVSTQGSGGKQGPIHVVVDESLGSTIFKWVRFFMIFGFVCYFSLVVVTMIVESFNSFKRTGTARADAEVKAESQKARFADVHGCDEAKEELQEVVEFLKNPDKFSTLGGKLPKGVLLVGPPGTGKTLLARAVAGEAGVPFFYMSGSEFDEVYVGVGAKRVRDLFNAARSKSPAIIFIDELDAIGGKRNTRDSTYVKQTLNQLLTELDGFDQSSQVIIIAATNFPKLLDKALTRPGRFDRHVSVDLPDVRGRLSILQHHAKKVKLAEKINLQELAQGTSGLSGAELENIVNSAAIHASKNKSPFISMKDLIWAKDKVVMGAEKRSMVISEKEKLMTAYHEAGHALAALYTAAQPIALYKVTILPRGGTLGHTAFLPEMDKHSWTTSDYHARIDCAMGGKVAEEIVYGNDLVTSGVSGDLNNATDLAFQMVAYFGMGGGGLAPMDFGSRYNNLSPATREQVEREVQKMLTESYGRTREMLIAKRKELDRLAEALVDYETLDKAEVLKVIKGESLTDRMKMPRDGHMTVPISSSPLEGLPPIGGGEQQGGSEPPPPAPPAPPASV